MSKYLRCTNCGYDLYGPEYLVNSLDPMHSYSQIFHSTNALLETCKKSNDSIACPFCHSQGTLIS